jgi:hypothetical protein
MSGNTIFQSLVGEGGRCGKNWPTEIVEIATHFEFDENDGFFTTSCDTVTRYVCEFRHREYDFTNRREVFSDFFVPPLEQYDFLKFIHKK